MHTSNRQKYKLNPTVPLSILKSDSFKDRLARALAEGNSGEAQYSLAHMGKSELDRLKILVECLPEEMAPHQRTAAFSCISAARQPHIRNIFNSKFYESWQKRTFAEVFRDESGKMRECIIPGLYASLVHHSKVYPSYGDALSKVWLSYYIAELYAHKQQALSHYLQMYSTRVFGQYESNVSSYIRNLILNSEEPVSDALKKHLSLSILRGPAKHNALLALMSADESLAKEYASIVIESHMKRLGHVSIDTVALAHKLL
ncbi:MAG: hypothetical protein N3H30_02230 [Candidatus Micrarchaeota archaeon]|nr:hypothetical protein [Candidatus Micrarchaeota archaeon]